VSTISLSKSNWENRQKSFAKKAIVQSVLNVQTLSTGNVCHDAIKSSNGFGGLFL
jgi:hypothetical protein